MLNQHIIHRYPILLLYFDNEMSKFNYLQNSEII
jgi:hypothetical protein